MTEELIPTGSQGRKPGVKLEQTNSPILLQTELVLPLPEEDADPKNSWEKAYNALRKQEPKIVDAYEKDLLASEDLYHRGGFRAE